MSFFAARTVLGADSKPKLLGDVAVRLEPCDPFPHIEPGVKGKVSFLITNKADHELQLQWKAQITLPGNQPLSINERIDLAPGASKRLPMPDQTTARRGVVSFAWTLSDQDGRALSLTDHLGVMTLPGPEKTHRANFRFGWGTSLVHFVTQMGEEKSMATYAQMGCDMIRVGDQWMSTQGPNDNYWDSRHTNTTRIIDAAAAADMDVLYVMWGTPNWAARSTFSNKDQIPELAKSTKTELGKMLPVRPPELAAWQTRIKNTVGQFKDRVKFWEIWNDQDRYHDGGQHMPNGWVGNTDEYLELLRTSHRDIKAIDPTLTVLNGGFFTVAKDAKHDLNPDMQQRVVREAQDSFDIHATLNDTHPGLLLGPMTELRKEFKNPKPLWITRVEQRGAQPDELVRRLLAAKGCGASAFIWMWAQQFDSGYRGFLMPMNTWKTKDRQSINQHSYFQMLPAGCAYVHAIGLLRMLPAAGRLDTKIPGQWLFAFADPTAKKSPQVVGFWHDEKLPDTMVSLRVGPNAVCSLLDLFGNAEPLTVAPGGSVSIAIKHTPAYLLIQGGEKVALVH